MVIPPGSYPAGSPAAPVLGASENGHYVSSSRYLQTLNVSTGSLRSSGASLKTIENTPLDGTSSNWNGWGTAPSWNQLRPERPEVAFS